ncbi:DEAD/DEAH box helicase [Dyadobacter tibetensis]|uniref:DEAD/DEAH box helicase n=1 Tax=Dyadobacter tibetensis TaxID=1211851 RepID=UPI000471E1D8|nr:DEAD/DEAH box helicase [Dyadobacter tibetensis]
MHVHHIPDISFETLSQNDILRQSTTLPDTKVFGYLGLNPQVIVSNYAVFLVPEGNSYFYQTEIRQDQYGLNLSCTCNSPNGKLCDHQVRSLSILLHNKNLKIFFDKKLRHQRLRQEGEDYGLSADDDPDLYFQILYQDNQLHFVPLIKDLIPINENTIEQLELQLWQNVARTNNLPSILPDMVLVFGRNKYYDHLYLELYQVERSKNGKIKAPLRLLDPLDLLGKCQQVDLIKFFSSLLRFRNSFRESTPETDVEALVEVVKNPLQLECYFHQPERSDNVTVSSLKYIQLNQPHADMELLVTQKKQFFEIQGHLLLDGKKYNLSTVTPKFDYFVLTADKMNLIQNPDYMNVIFLFNRQDEKLILHASKYELFKERILVKIEAQIKVIYSYLRRVPLSDLSPVNEATRLERIIYLSESGHFILITPVMRYGPTEVPIFSTRQVHAVDQHGNPYIVRRDEEEEIRFAAVIKRQHPDFIMQEPRESYYLNKNTFLDEDWFLNAFDEWRDLSIRIYGFNQLSNNIRNPNKAKISVIVASGINWFLPEIQVFFGKQKVSLKNLQKAARNKKRYVLLEDGTEGIMPEEWILLLEKYFRAGELEGSEFRIPKYNFQVVSELFDKSQLDETVQLELEKIQDRMNNFQRIKYQKTPKALRTSLRNYQKEGLNWLSFLDEFGFGGCLADDMGLGKTVQIIAFILSLKEKNGRRLHMIVVPTSLLFNWRVEIERFAPDLRIEIHHGSARPVFSKVQEETDILLTTYGTMVSDIRLFQKIEFDYIFLDESQAIKNPDSQRYKAARTLKSRSRIVLTGTPFENNTMDIYGQLSFACPGLLGSKIDFRNRYINPIDRFQVENPTLALQKRIKPFILRRTKVVVAPELPDKTEQILYCEMGVEQQRLYRAYEQEFYNYLNSKVEGDIQRHRLHILQGLTKLRQICNAPSLLNDEVYYGGESAKISILMEQLKEKHSGHKVLVFSQFVGMLDLIRKELDREEIPHSYLTGKSTNREQIVTNFQNNPSLKVFLISLKAGGTGLNLTEAEYVYLIDPWWNPAVENQAIDRSHRIGQKRKVMAIRLISPDTIEEKMMKLQQTKLDRANELIGTDRHILKNLSKQDLLNLLTP